MVLVSVLMAALFETCQATRAAPINPVSQPPFYEPEYLPRQPSHAQSNNPLDPMGGGVLPSNLIEPEYFHALPQARRINNPVVPRVDTAGQVTEVAEYVNNNKQGVPASPLNFLEVSTKVTVEHQHADHVFMDAVLTDDLQQEMRNVKEGEKFIVRHSTEKRNVAPASFFDHVKLKKSSVESKPEQAPSNLPHELSGVFQQLAEKYEDNFQNHFKKGPPHPEVYESGNSHLLASYEMSAEPQILLPVPASLLFEIVSKYREQTQAKKANPILVESSSKSNPSGFNYFEAPAMIPSAALGPPGNGRWMSSGGPLSAVPMSSPMPPPGGIVSLGVQSPPPPLRPDNLPPPPYISPLVVDDQKSEAGAPTAPAPK